LSLFAIKYVAARARIYWATDQNKDKKDQNSLKTTFRFFCAAKTSAKT
jgi:hypothetical protein